MPKRHAVAAYWQTAPVSPWSRAVDVLLDADVACCFACRTMGKQVRTWKEADSYFERAHLRDVRLGGNNAPHNLALLCHSCHTFMTRTFTGCRDCGIQWIRWLESFADT
ncbi:HNH endonuclease [Actinobacteria bacterium OV450]|nr:HNH endonuclease [Actinobacteria bacterium OV450]